MHKRPDDTSEETIHLESLGKYYTAIPIANGVKQLAPNLDNRSILFFDTCAIFDIARVSNSETEWKLKADNIKAFQKIISQSLNNEIVIVIAAQVLREIKDNEKIIKTGTRSSFEKLQNNLSHALEILEILEIKLDKSFENFEKAGESPTRKVKDNISILLDKATLIREDCSIVYAALERVRSGRKPAAGNKQSMKDCVIIETYLEFNRQLKKLPNQNQFPEPIFISSNTKDYGGSEDDHSKDGLNGLKYAESLMVAVALLGKDKNSGVT